MSNPGSNLGKPCKKSTFTAVSLLVTAATHVASAQTAETVGPDALPDEGLSHLLEVASFGEYARVLDPERAGGLENVFVFGSRARLYLGRNVSYCTGLDGSIGASNTGLVYGLTGYVAGIAARFDDASVISLCGGAGFDGVKAAVPMAARAPAELSLAVSLGPLRPILWLRPAWVVSGDARTEGSSVSFIDELDAGLLLRLGRQHRYWAETSAGAGLAIGVSYRELLDTRSIGVMIGLDLAGAR